MTSMPPPTPPPGMPPPPAAPQWPAANAPQWSAAPAPFAYQKTNGFAVAALVLGVLFCLGISGILAVVFGNLALGQIDRSQGAQKGRGLAIAGIVLGWLGIALLAIPALVWFGYGVSNL